MCAPLRGGPLQQPEQAVDQSPHHPLLFRAFEDLVPSKPDFPLLTFAFLPSVDCLVSGLTGGEGQIILSSLLCQILEPLLSVVGLGVHLSDSRPGYPSSCFG